jgi:hypothetical protein
MRKRKHNVKTKRVYRRHRWDHDGRRPSLDMPTKPRRKKAKTHRRTRAKSPHGHKKARDQFALDTWDRTRPHGARSHPKVAASRKQANPAWKDTRWQRKGKRS